MKTDMQNDNETTDLQPMAANEERDITLLDHGADFFSVKISGATYRNLKKLADFMKAHDMEGGEGPWGDSLDLETAIHLAGFHYGFTGEDAYCDAESVIYTFDFEGGDAELEQTVRDVKTIDFE